ncbi:dTMP kinase [Candidatus Pelagibacter sp.]|nr:dTMP kinase [Candidatus Pelagibacter sp.]
MSKKPIIVFEGIEGSGKSYHISNVAKYLNKKKIEYIKIREPGGSFNSEKIRKLLLSNKSNFTNNTDLFLILASRSENIRLIKKNYRKKIILIDRFIDSTIAYQHYGMNIDLKLIRLLNTYILDNLKIDFTFLNTVNKKNLLKRLKKRKSLNRYDKFKMSFYKKVQNGFLKLAKFKKKSYLIVNSDLEIKNNKKIVLEQIDKLLK